MPIIWASLKRLFFMGQWEKKQTVKTTVRLYFSLAYF